MHTRFTERGKFCPVDIVQLCLISLRIVDLLDGKFGFLVLACHYVEAGSVGSHQPEEHSDCHHQEHGLDRKYVSIVSIVFKRLFILISRQNRSH